MIYRPLEGVNGCVWDHYGVYISDDEIIDFTQDVDGSGLREIRDRIILVNICKLT